MQNYHRAFISSDLDGFCIEIKVCWISRGELHILKGK